MLINASELPIGEHAQFLQDVNTGLGNSPKTLPSKYFYNERGSELFDQICELDEYYLTRTETGLMEQHAYAMSDLIGRNAALVELGSGSSHKSRLLLEQVATETHYIPVDISREHLFKSARDVEIEFPELHVHPLHADFTQPLGLTNVMRESDRIVVYFPGSTIGNFDAVAAENLLKQIAELASPQGGLLIGFDLVKDRCVLEAAYNDQEGVTAAFNKNLLLRINEQLQGTFELDQFEHIAKFVEESSRIEMHLTALKSQTVSVADYEYEFEAGETICTEYSHKYTLVGFSKMASRAGLELRQVWTDSDDYFAVAFYDIR